MPIISRRNFLGASACTALAVTTAPFCVFEHSAGATPTLADEPKSAANAVLDQFVESYMRAMNSPGMTLGIANRTGTLRVTTYGHGDLALKEPVAPDQLFHIGSITKSFVALVLLQLREEGKVDLQRPVLDYLPWLPLENTFAPITTHHLLTHTSGLPDDGVPFPSDPATKYRQAYKPGERFSYSNLGFAMLGSLIEHLDKRSWPAAVKERIIERLGMSATSPVIFNGIRARTVDSYLPFFADRPYTRYGRLAPVGIVQFDDAAGSIASTAADMTRYMQMLLNRGQALQGRIVSDESFAMMSKPYVKAEPFGPTASYGYGIGVDTLNGHTVLRHTGGMPSFMSAIIMDLDGGVGAFASINAQQGYRPTQVAQYAMQVASEGTGLNPAAPKLDDPMLIDNCSDYAGGYKTADGKELDISASGKNLFANIAGRRAGLQHLRGDEFITEYPELSGYALAFGRGKTSDRKRGPVVEIIHGGDWYTNSRYDGPRQFVVPEIYRSLTGRYLTNGMFGEGVDIVLVKGALWVDGTTRLEQIGEYTFRPVAEPSSPETVEFRYLVDGKALLLKWSGADFWRFETI
jgi:D-alanyl-D-alanine carboxypeptidase